MNIQRLVTTTATAFATGAITNHFLGSSNSSTLKALLYGGTVVAAVQIASQILYGMADDLANGTYGGRDKSSFPLWVYLGSSISLTYVAKSFFNMRSDAALVNWVMPAVVCICCDQSR